ncbi:hypothetical protein ACP6JE_001233 [Aspergillus fumigatus]
MGDKQQMEAEGAECDRKELLNNRACDQCRLRKVRCDKRSPCSNCRSAGIVCRSTGAGQKPKEDRRRVLISSQYEKKIDSIEERLGNIEEVLLELKSSLARNSNTSEPCYHVTPVSKQMSPDSSAFASNTTAALEHESGTGFEGNSSLAAHSAYASAFLETVVSRSAPQVSTPKINAALAALRQMVNMQSQPPGTSSKDVPLLNQKSCRDSNLRDLVMPPIEVILPILRQIKVNCGLYHIFLEYSFLEESPRIRDDYQKYIQLCRKNFETVLANLPLLMPARPELIEALTLGDFDIIITIPEDLGGPRVDEPWRTMYHLWVKTAEIQGKVYEQLYSPAALSRPERERLFCARQLASEMEVAVMEPFKVGIPWRSSLP